MAKYDSVGNYNWAFKIGSPSSTTPYYSYAGFGLTADTLQNVWMAGWFKNANNDFDPNAGTYTLSAVAGEQAAFISKYGTATTGFDELNEDDQLVIYPNPVYNTFNIKSTIAWDQQVNIYDATGRLVLSRQVSGTAAIEVSQLPPGIYNLVINSRNSFVKKKLVVIK